MNMNAAAMNLMDDQNRSVTYEDLLKTSISYFLGEYPQSVSNLSNLVSLYRKLIQDLNDPPLEIVWFYSAVVFHSYPSSLPPPGKLLVAEELLKLVNECSSLCGALRKVAVIAPVVYLLYHLEIKISARDPSLREEISTAVDGIVSYISICCSQYLDEGGQGSDHLGVSMLDLIRIWMVHQAKDSYQFNILASFFPTVRNEFQPEVMCLGYLAGVVMIETLFLRLCLKISPGIDKEDMRRNLLNVAIQTIKGFQNYYFLDILLRMLSGPSLPVAATVSYEDAVLLRKVLYDAVILVDYSFYSGRWDLSSVGQLKRLALSWVIAADHAIHFARSASDQSRAISYLNAFHECQLMAELIKWVCSEAGTMDQNTIPDMTNPKALINWLLILDDQGFEVFEHSMSILHARAVACVLTEQPPELQLHIGNLNNTIFNLNETDESEHPEMGGQSTNGSAGALSWTGAKNDAGRKRKGDLNGSQEPDGKQVRLDHLGGSVGNKFLSLSGGDGARGEGLD